MKKYRPVFLLLISAFLFAGVASAQYANRKWALESTGSVLVKPVLTTTSGLSTGRGSGGAHLKGELFLRDKWYAQAGYFRSEVSYGEGNRTMEGMQLGIKRYFLHPETIFQPYVLAAGQLNWGRHTEYTHTAYNDYARTQQTVNPRIAFLPGVGFDLYLFSSVAFVAEYSFNMGINSRTLLEVSPAGGIPYRMGDRGMYHNLSLGVKVTFPFTVTSQDGYTLYELIWVFLEGLDLFGHLWWE